jgi:cupin 2 domain-containing protein
MDTKTATPRNLLADLPAPGSDEAFEPLASGAGVRIERIVSRAHRSPDGFWYDQAEHEWVVVLEGGAGLRFEGARDAVVLRRGDALSIPAHTRHRVEWTEEPTVWLAVHYQ